MDQAFATVELLELILLEIDTQTLLTSANRVSRYWHNVIQQSVQLQTKLFLRSLLVPQQDDDNKHNKQGQVSAAICTNTLLLSRFQDLLGNNKSPKDNNGDSDKISRPEASWRRMLLQQPPVRKLGVWRLDTGYALYHGFSSTTEILQYYENDTAEPLTMEALVNYSKTLPKGYSWDIFTGDQEKTRQLEREKKSFFVIKSAMKERQALEDMWRTADVVVKLTRWLGGI